MTLTSSLIALADMHGLTEMTHFLTTQGKKSSHEASLLPPCRYKKYRVLPFGPELPNDETLRTLMDIMVDSRMVKLEQRFSKGILMLLAEIGRQANFDREIARAGHLGFAILQCSSKVISRPISQ